MHTELCFKWISKLIIKSSFKVAGCTFVFTKVILPSRFACRIFD